LGGTQTGSEPYFPTELSCVALHLSANRQLTLKGRKMQRRLQDLERRAGSALAPPQKPAEFPYKSQSGKGHQTYKKRPDICEPPSSAGLQPSQLVSPMQSDNNGIFAKNFEHDESRTLSRFAYHQYSPPEDAFYPYTESYRPVLSSSDWKRTNINYLEVVSPKLPYMMPFIDAITWEYEDSLTPFNMTYQRLPAGTQQDHNEPGTLTQ
jgi:hypothetical protein